MQQYVTIHVTIHVTIPCNNWNLVGGVHVAFVYRKEKNLLSFLLWKRNVCDPPPNSNCYMELLHGLLHGLLHIVA